MRANIRGIHTVLLPRRVSRSRDSQCRLFGHRTNLDLYAVQTRRLGPSDALRRPTSLSSPLAHCKRSIGTRPGSDPGLFVNLTTPLCLMTSIIQARVLRRVV